MQEGIVEDPKVAVVSRLKLVNNQIKPLYDQRKVTGRLSDMELVELKNLHISKGQECVTLCQLRHSGISNGIEIEVTGRRQDMLHPYSRNIILFSVRLDDLPFPYVTMSSIHDLRRSCGGDISSLIDKPDKFSPETPEDYIRRTMSEVNEVSKERWIKKRTDGEEEESEALLELHLALAKRVFRTQASGEVTVGSLVVYWREPLLECVYLDQPHLYNFRISRSDYEKDTELQELGNSLMNS